MKSFKKMTRAEKKFINYRASYCNARPLTDKFHRKPKDATTR